MYCKEKKTKCSVRNKRATGLSVLLAAALVFTGAVVPGGLSIASAEDANVHYIAVASDRHGNTKAIKTAMSGMPSSVEYVVLDGDMENVQQGTKSQTAYNTSEVFNEVKSVFPGISSYNVSIVYGSHDANATDDAGIMECVAPGAVPAEDGKNSDEISMGMSGLIYTANDSDKDGNPDYYIYGVSYYDMTNPGTVIDEEDEDDDSGLVVPPVVMPDGTVFTDDDDDEDVIYNAGGADSAEAFEEFADEHPDVPIIVVGHVPIHYKRNDNLAATYWNDALNYAATGSEVVSEDTEVTRDVCYIYGHNHPKDSNEYFNKPGDTIKVQSTSKNEYEESVIQYSYLTGGYLNDNHTASLVTVRDGKLYFDKYKGYTASFDTRGGSYAEEQYVQKGSLVQYPDDPSREGYRFTGWFKEPTCENVWDFDTDKISGDTVIYAGWAKVE